MSVVRGCAASNRRGTCRSRDRGPLFQASPVCEADAAQTGPVRADHVAGSRPDRPGVRERNRRRRPSSRRRAVQSTQARLGLVRNRLIDERAWKAAERVLETGQTTDADLSVKNPAGRRERIAVRCVTRQLSREETDFVVLFADDDSEQVRMEATRRQFRSEAMIAAQDAGRGDRSARGGVARVR